MVSKDGVVCVEYVVSKIQSQEAYKKVVIGRKNFTLIRVKGDRENDHHSCCAEEVFADYFGMVVGIK